MDSQTNTYLKLGLPQIELSVKAGTERILAQIASLNGLNEASFSTITTLMAATETNRHKEIGLGEESKEVHVKTKIQI